MVRHGGDVYRNPNLLDFSANLNFLGMPDAVREAAERGVGKADCYPDVRCEALREAIAAREGVESAQIVCGNGACDLIDALILAEKPRRAIVCSPTFGEYRRALRAMGTRIIPYPLAEENGFCFDRRLLPLLTEDVDLLVLCSPNNPTGTVLKGDLLDSILETCQERGIRVLLDECFVDFLDEPEKVTALPRLPQFPCLFLLKAFTKLYDMPGLRLGYAMTADRKLLRRLEEVRQPWSVSVPAQCAGIAAAGEVEYVRRTHRELRRERAWLRRALTDAGMKVYASQANFLFFRGKTGLAEQLEERGICIRDCSDFDGLTPGYYRAAVRSRGENRELIRQIQSVL